MFRFLSTLNYSVPLATNATVSKDECREFMSVFPGNLCGFLEMVFFFTDGKFHNFPQIFRHGPRLNRKGKEIRLKRRIQMVGQSKY